MFNYVYADILVMIVNPGIYQKAASSMTVESFSNFTVRGQDGWGPDLLRKHDLR
jgi:hypothetical protein